MILVWKGCVQDKDKLKFKEKEKNIERKNTYDNVSFLDRSLVSLIEWGLKNWALVGIVYPLFIGYIEFKEQTIN